MNRVLDLLIIGAGPVGLAAAIEARRAGLNVELLEQGTIAHTVYRFPLEMSFFSEARKIEIGGHPLVSLGAKPTRGEALQYYRRVAEAEALEVRLFTRAKRILVRQPGFVVEAQDQDGPRNSSATRVMVATGYFDRPNRLSVEGEELPHVFHTYTEAAPFWRRRVIVVGGSNSAVETALDLYRAGALVTLVHRGPEIRSGVKYWLKPDFENRVAEGSIEALMLHRVKAIEPRVVWLAGPGSKVRRQAADAVIVQIGYRAVDDLLREAGAAFEGGHPLVSGYFETSVPGLFVVGSAGFGRDTHSVFIENGREHARVAVAEIVQRGTSSKAGAR